MVTDNGTVLKIRSDISGRSEWHISAPKEVSRIELKIREQGKDEILLTVNEQIGKADFTTETVIKEPRLWRLSSPSLYEYELLLIFADGQELICGRLAFRELKADKCGIYLNGEKVFIRGYIRGAKAHEHSNNCKLSDEDFYRKNITQAKKFGFNYIRFHSTIPPEALFRAADELGMLIHIELRAENDEYNNLEEMLFSSRDLVSEAFVDSVIDKLYNHPSLAVYCLGNELKSLGNPKRVDELGEFIKKTDPSRLFVDTCAWGKKDRANIDFDVQHMSYYFPFGKHKQMFDDVKSIHAFEDAFKDGGEAELSVPLLAHETCHYTALRDFKSLDKKFKAYGTEKPWWIDEEFKMIKHKGLCECYDELYEASKTFQLECWKTAFEEIRKSSILSGYHFLQFADTDVYENSNGVVDCFDDESYVTPEAFLKFNGDRVIMADLATSHLVGGKKVSIPVIYSDYGEEADTEAILTYVLKDGAGSILEQKSISGLDTSKGGLTRLADIDICLPSVSKAQAFSLSLNLTTAKGFTADNGYKLWVYPDMKAPTYRELCSYEQGDAVITDSIERALAALNEGKRVCLIYRNPWTRHVADKTMFAPSYALKATWNRFKPVIWDRGTNYGGICDAELLNRYGFVTDRIYSFNYSVITEDCDKIILDGFPTPVRSIISGIDKNVRDRFDAYKVGFNLPELQYDRTLRNFSYLFELAVGKGSLLVCGLNLTGVDEGEPSAVAMAEFIKRYITSPDFAPENAISPEAFTDYMKECAKEPVKERMMTQFWQLDDTPVESKEYWIESRKYLQ